MDHAGKEERARAESFCLWIHVKPRAREDAIVGWRGDDCLELRVRALPVRGAANDSCCKQLARALGVAPSRLCVEKGHTVARKRIRVQGLTREEGMRLLADFQRPKKG